MRTGRMLISSVAVVALMGLAGCGGKKEPASTGVSGVQCVQLSEGQYYWDGTKFTVAPAPKPEVIERVVEAPVGWDRELERTFPDLGFPWMGLRVRDRVATLTGLAPDLSTKERGLAAGEAAVMDHPRGREEVMLVVDGIAVEGGERGVGESLAALSDTALSLKACQNAFNETMQGRNVQFQTNLAIISPTSARLLDAVTGVALLCQDYNVEIGGHTDSRGSDQYNEILSQQRADAVREYLIEKGVEAEGLFAKGYGESHPIDRSETYEAWAKNRRTEFKVSDR